MIQTLKIRKSRQCVEIRTNDGNGSFAVIAIDGDKVLVSLDFPAHWKVDVETVPIIDQIPQSKAGEGR